LFFSQNIVKVFNTLKIIKREKGKAIPVTGRGGP
jgi:hypothetical protein